MKIDVRKRAELVIKAGPHVLLSDVHGNARVVYAMAERIIELEDIISGRIEVQDRGLDDVPSEPEGAHPWVHDEGFDDE